MRLHRYRATIRGSKLPLFQVYFAVSLLPFCASRQPKYVSSYCCSCLLSHELLVLSLSPKDLVYLGFVEVAFTALLLLRLIVKLLY